MARLQQASTTAVTALLKVMVDPATPASARVRAADIVLSHASNAIELDEIEARLTELEQAAASREAMKQLRKRLTKLAQRLPSNEEPRVIRAVFVRGDGVEVSSKEFTVSCGHGRQS